MTTADLIRECLERSESKEGGYDKQLLADAAGALMTLSAKLVAIVPQGPPVVVSEAVGSAPLGVGDGGGTSGGLMPGAGFTAAQSSGGACMLNGPATGGGSR